MDGVEQELKETALRVVRGGEISLFDLLGLGSIIKVETIKSGLVPGSRTISGKSIDRKGEIFRIAEGLWGVSPGRWLEMENEWLKSSRAKSGSTETGGKDSLDDVVSAELLVRILATIKIVTDYNKIEGGEAVSWEAVSALNLALTDAVSKGRTRMSRFGSQSHYTILKNSGVMVGAPGGKYLPDPEVSLVYLFQMFGENKILSSAYA